MAGVDVSQPRLFDIERTPRLYHDSITAVVNAKGCMDVDTVKGCTEGMRSEPGGCYGECYAAKIAERYGIAFETSVKRGFVDQWQHRDILVNVWCLAENNHLHARDRQRSNGTGTGIPGCWANATRDQFDQRIEVCAIGKANQIGNVINPRCLEAGINFVRRGDQ